MKRERNTEDTRCQSYDDEIMLLDAKHREKMDSMEKVMRDMQDQYIKERCKLIESKTKHNILSENTSNNYLTEFIDIELAGKFIKRSAGWIYRNMYDVDTQEPVDDRSVPAHKKGKRYFFVRKELQEWMFGGNTTNNLIESQVQAYLSANPK